MSAESLCEFRRALDTWWTSVRLNGLRWTFTNIKITGGLK